ncbi:uncharacterized protein LOC134745814 [Cydia strobilella]|uniref:uncharacterized protein LOC134745814 n=1 Tax=Cydia strobilella TaxID=1100964 RepID=UPI003007BC8C
MRYLQSENTAIHHAVRQAIISGLIIEHNPRSGTYIIHDAVRKTVKTGLHNDHNKNNAVDSALVDQLVPKTGRGKIHNLLRQLLKARMEEEDISGKTDGVIHKRAQQVMK